MQTDIVLAFENLRWSQRKLINFTSRTGNQIEREAGGAAKDLMRGVEAPDVPRATNGKLHQVGSRDLLHALRLRLASGQ